MVVVLLTIVGIAAVLLFWSIFSGMIRPQLRVKIEQAVIYVDTQQVLQISISNVGTRDFVVDTIEVIGVGSASSCNPSLGETIPAGAVVQYSCQISGVDPTQASYLVRVDVSSGNDKASDTAPALVRRI